MLAAITLVNSSFWMDSLVPPAEGAPDFSDVVMFLTHPEATGATYAIPVTLQVPPRAGGGTGWAKGRGRLRGHLLVIKLIALFG
jgi:hypothetical protein